MYSMFHVVDVSNMFVLENSREKPLVMGQNPVYDAYFIAQENDQLV